MNPEETTPHYAGFWIRFFACCIDLVIYALPYTLLIVLLPERITADIVFIIFALLSYAWFFSAPWQASPGMYMLKIHVRHQNGRPLTFWQAIVWGIVSSMGWLLIFAAVLYIGQHYHVEEALAYMQTHPGDVEGVEAIMGIPMVQYVNISLSCIGLSIFLALIWSLSIALSKEKTGFHNIICHTRFYRGRAKDFEHA